MLRIAEKIDIPVVGPMLVERGGEEDYRRFFPATSKIGIAKLVLNQTPGAGYNASTRGPRWQKPRSLQRFATRLHKSSAATGFAFVWHT